MWREQGNVVPASQPWDRFFFLAISCVREAPKAEGAHRCPGMAWTARAGAHLRAVVAPLKNLVWAEAQVSLPQTILCQRSGFKIFAQNLLYYCKSSRSPFWKTDPTGWPAKFFHLLTTSTLSYQFVWVFNFLCVNANWFSLMLIRPEGGGDLTSPCYHNASCYWARSLPVQGQPLGRSQLKATNFLKEHLRLLWLQLHAQGIHFCLL